MKITELKNNENEFHARVSIPMEDVQNDINRRLLDISKTAKIDGFRVGKAPKSILNKKYGSSIKDDIIGKTINSTIDNIVEKYNLNVAMDPAIENLISEIDSDLEFTIKLDLVPKIELPDFTNISVEKPILKVTDVDVEERINEMAKLSKTYDSKVINNIAQKGDQIIIDTIGYVDKKVFDGGNLTDYKLILGSNSFIPGFEDQLLGSKTNDIINVKVTFPIEYHSKKLAGKDAEFQVTVKSIYQAIVPEVNDKFAKKFKCDTVVQLRDQVKKNFSRAYEQQIHIMMKMHLFSQIDNITKINLPKSLILREVKILQKQNEQLENSNINKKSGKEKDQYLTQVASRRVSIGLILAEYVKIKNIKITEDDVRRAILLQAKNYPGQESKVVEYYQKDRQALESLKGPILEEKAVKEIFNNEIKLNEKVYNKHELEELLQTEIK